MKILHTSDWHLGKGTIAGHSRKEQQIYFLEQLTQIIKQEQPDCLIVSGDIFDLSNPNLEEQEIYNKYILQIHDSCKQMQIIVTAGNHDSARRLELNNEFMPYFNISVIGRVEYKEQQEGQLQINCNKHIIPIKSNKDDKKIIGYVVAIPYVYQANCCGIINQILTYANQEVNTNKLPLVLSCHLTLDKVDYGNQEYIGGSKAIAYEDFENTYDYMALGHIHKPQTIQQTNKKARYCGTPLAISFNEEYTYTKHSVTIAEIESGKEPQIREIEIKDSKPFKTLPNLDEPLSFEDMMDYIKNHPKEVENKFIRLYINMDKSDNHCSAKQATAICEQYGGTFCEFKYYYGQENNKTVVEHLTTTELLHKDPIEIAKMYAQQKNISWKEEYSQMIEEAKNYNRE